MINRWKKWLVIHEWWTLGGIGIILATLSLGNMTRWSIWFDEAFSAYLIRFNYVDIAHYTGLDVHPPLYYWVLKMWTTPWGVTELSVRSLSLVWALVALVGIYLLFRRVFGSKHVALVASLAFAISPMMIRYSDEARMYTMVTAIVIWATYLLVKLQKSTSLKGWLGYGLLIAVGMWTHYFVAFAWLAHWVWRWIEYRRGTIKRFWSREWMMAYGFAILLFSPWLLTAAKQLATAQAGFWIRPLSAYTPIDYTSNALIYREYGAVTYGWPVVYWLGLGAVLYIVLKAWRAAKQKQRLYHRLLLVVAFVPPLLVMIISLPPLHSSFIDRYLLASIGVSSALIGASLALVWHELSRKFATLLAVILLATAGCGIFNVYYYGNFNKDSNTSVRTRDVVQQVAQGGEAGQPIIAASPWVYYEAAFYSTADHPVYFLDSSTHYEYGSLAMLHDNSFGKITDLTAFTASHRYVWYLDNTSGSSLKPPVTGWKLIKSVAMYDYISNSAPYQAGLYDTRP